MWCYSVLRQETSDPVSNGANSELSDYLFERLHRPLCQSVRGWMVRSDLDVTYAILLAKLLKFGCYELGSIVRYQRFRNAEPCKQLSQLLYRCQSSRRLHGVGVKPGLWTMDWTVGLDPWTGLMDCLWTSRVWERSRCMRTRALELNHWLTRRSWRTSRSI